MAAIEAPTAFEACWLDGVGAHFRWEEASAAARYRLYIQSSIIAETRFAARFVEMATIEDILSARVTSVDFDGRESGPSLAPEWFDCGSGIPPHAFEPQRDRF